MRQLVMIPVQLLVFRRWDGGGGCRKGLRLRQRVISFNFLILNQEEPIVGHVTQHLEASAVKSCEVSNVAATTASTDQYQLGHMTM